MAASGTRSTSTGVNEAVPGSPPASRASTRRPAASAENAAPAASRPGAVEQRAERAGEPAARGEHLADALRRGVDVERAPGRPVGGRPPVRRSRRRAPRPPPAPGRSPRAPRLRAHGEDVVAHEGERRRAGAEHAHAAVGGGPVEVADARDERLRPGPVGDGGQQQRVGRRDGGVGRLVAEPGRTSRSSVNAPGATAEASESRRRATEGSVACQPREAGVLGALRVRGEVRVDERVARDEPGERVGRAVLPAAAQQREREGGDQHRCGRDGEAVRRCRFTPRGGAACARRSRSRAGSPPARSAPAGGSPRSRRSRG